MFAAEWAHVVFRLLNGARKRQFPRVKKLALGGAGPHELRIHSVDSAPAIYPTYEAALWMSSSFLEDSRKCLCKNLRHVLSCHSLRGMQREAFHLVSNDRLLGSAPVPNLVISRQNNPSLSARSREPNFIVGILREKVVVCENVRMDLTQPVWNLSAAEAPVAEETGLRRRLARGATLRFELPLRSFRSQDRSPQPVPLWVRPQRSAQRCRTFECRCLRSQEIQRLFADL